MSKIFVLRHTIHKPFQLKGNEDKNRLIGVNDGHVMIPVLMKYLQ